MLTALTAVALTSPDRTLTLLMVEVVLARNGPLAGPVLAVVVITPVWRAFGMFTVPVVALAK